MTPTSVSALSLLVLKTSDLERAHRFYAAIGLDFQQEQHGSGPPHYSTQIGPTILELYPLRPQDTADASTRLGFTVPDLASTLERLKEANVVVTSEARTMPWGNRAVVRDPDGRSIELCEQ